MIECPFCESESDRDSCTHWYGGFSELHDCLTGNVSDFQDPIRQILIDWISLTSAKVSIDTDFGSWISDTDWELRDQAKKSPPSADPENAANWLNEHLYWPSASREFADFLFYECIQEEAEAGTTQYTEYNPTSEGSDDEVMDDEDRDEEEDCDEIPGMSFGSKDIWVTADHQALTRQVHSCLEVMRVRLKGKWTTGTQAD